MNGAVTSCDGSERGTVRRSFDETMITPYILTHMYSCTDLETLDVILSRYQATNFKMRDERHELDSSNKILLTNMSGEFLDASNKIPIEMANSEKLTSHNKLQQVDDDNN